MPKGVYQRRTTHENFLLKVKISESGCWEWVGSKLKDGYGHFHVNRVGIPAHRYSYKFYKGEIPDGCVIRHTCDNPSCVNPDHLQVGTQKENYDDSKMKGRHSHGEAHGNSVYSEQQIRKVMQLIADGIKPKVVSDKTGVALSTVYDIKGGRSWQHLK